MGHGILSTGGSSTKAKYWPVMVIARPSMEIDEGKDLFAMTATPANVGEPRRTLDTDAHRQSERWRTSVNARERCARELQTMDAGGQRGPWQTPMDGQLARARQPATAEGRSAR